ncbi:MULTISPECIES: DUF4870 domain-containing protein [Mesonia]|uniref:Uncharacterized protein n=1 Tax=Mesonia oceanica TaxID=2687242 RepID=A0AC61Y517_9FLAO|nr:MULTISPECIES: DUF4870 domain-containing protein [Mesonia]MAN28029.1 hypothetical protein [Mesonia sp.]MAQ42440.1 hypothetical protein [Mesonia sp.]MBJ96746.1 hypothetical protein [Flavobacteriaceae bacterium]VVU99274.1 hypothetical protein FVB9532_00526 [Mesonia oceanica]|tara:strand:- start:170 stop:685 length:516 start_codon:yes stop_codon:yes gene_type:complete
MQSINQKTISSIAHLGAFSKYFFPFGNFLVPIFIWVLHKKYPFVSAHAKQSLNFQISLFLYTSILATIAIMGLVVLGINFGTLDEFYFSTGNDFVISNQSPLFAMPFIVFLGIVLILAIGIFALEVLCVINAAMKAGEGKTYQYPLTIPFLKLEEAEKEDLPETNINNQTI